MSKKKGLSSDEKKSKMLEIFYETGDVLQLKDIEKLGTAAKGITLQSIKPILQELVDDGMVSSEKIGTSVYFWSFPSKNQYEIKQKLAELEKKNNEADKKLLALEQWVELEKNKDIDNEKINEIIAEISEIKEQNKKFEQQLNILKTNDPNLVDKKLKETKAIFEAANLWTDNIFNIKTWCKQKFGMQENDLDKHFGIADNFDYIEE